MGEFINACGELVTALGIKLKSSVGPLRDEYAIHTPLRLLLSKSNRKVSHAYKQSVWVYACIRAISSNIGRVPYVLKKDAGALEPNLIESGPLYDLHTNPNPYMTMKKLIEATITYLMLRGEAFWILDGRDNFTEIPSNLWTFDPIRFYPLWTDGQNPNLIGWEYKMKNNQEGEKFPFWNIIHFKLFNPYDDMRGLSPLEAASISVEADYSAGEYNRVFFENGAKIGGYISVPGELSDEQFDRLLKQFEQRHKGVGNAHKIALIEGDGKFTEAKITQRDMDFIEGKKLTREEILAAFGVNEVILGIYKNVKSMEGQRVANKSFWEQTLIPLILDFEETLWSMFYSKIGDQKTKGKVWGCFDLANVGPLQKNFSDKIDTAKTMFFMGWPINMINKRLELGMKEVDWGDQWWVPGGYRPVSILMKEEADEINDDGSSDTSSEEDIAQDFFDQGDYAHIADRFKSCFKRLIFENRKTVLSAIAMGKNISVNASAFKKFQISLAETYRYGVEEGLSQLGSFDAQTGVAEPLISKFMQRSEALGSSISKILDELVQRLNDFEGDKLEKAREVFSIIEKESSNFAWNEAEFSFGLGIEGANVEILDGVRKEFGDFDKERIKFLNNKR